VNRRNAYFTLKKILDRAVKYSYIRSNPCKVDGKPGADVAQVRPTWTEEDLARVLFTHLSS
jgi:hypothetical protein